MTTISVIVPIYNGGAAWAKCRGALLAAQPAPYEIIAVDDGSTDDSLTHALAAGLCILRTEQPQSGPAVARNLGAAHAHGAILFFIDADVVIPPDAMARVEGVFCDPHIDAIFGSYDDTPGDASFLSQYKNLMHHYVHQTSCEDASSFWAGCGAIRAEVFQKMGGFSNAYTRPMIEDIELGYRLKREGYQIRLVKDLQVKHLKRWTVHNLLTTDIFARAIPWARLLVRQSERPADLNLQFEHRVSAVCCLLLLVAFAGVFITPHAFFAVILLIVALVRLNILVYRFFLQKRGFTFMLGAILWHWFYYLYSSISFAWVLLDELRIRVVGRLAAVQPAKLRMSLPDMHDQP